MSDSPNCTEVLEDLQRYLDGEMPEPRVGQLRDHLAECYPCADRATFEEQVRALVRECCHETAPPGLIARIRARLDEVSAGADPAGGSAATGR